MRMMPAPGAGRPRGRAAVLRLLLAAALVVAVQGSCNAPPRIPSAELKESYQRITKFSYSEKVEYTCRPGYTRSKFRASLVCGEDGRWKGATDFCSPKQCSYPGDLANGRLVETELFTFGSIANYTCDMGYRLIGNSQLHCVLKNGQVTWDGDVPFCEPIPCSPPPKIENGEHNGGDVTVFSYGSSVTYHCNSAGRGERAFSLVGDPSIFCTTVDNLNGIWNKPAPECKVVGCQHPQIENGKLLSGYRAEYTYRDTVVFDCEFRYTLQGSDTSTCSEAGSWEPPLPLCQRSSCDDPPDVFSAVKARLAGNLFPAGTVVTYECEPGYEFSPGQNTRHITCLADLTWSEAPSSCNKISCPDPVVGNARPVNVWYKPVKYMYGDTVSISCNEGYTIRDYGSNVVLRCTNKGTWDPAVTECTSVPHCPQPVTDHGREVYKSKNDYSVGTRVTMTCDEGYVLRGDEQIECKADQNWTPSVPFCDKGCDPPPQITSGQYTASRSGVFPYGSEVTYSCAAGLSLIGDKSIYCTSTDGENLVWSGPAPECRVVRCPRPDVEHGRMAPPRHTFPYGVSVRFSCDEGFVLRGDAEIWCTANSTWQPPLPSCVPVQCPEPQVVNGRLKNARDSKTWYLANTTVTFECLHGYHFSGGGPAAFRDTGTATCLADGKWTPLPKCKKQGEADICEEVGDIKAAFECGVPMEEVRTLLEVQKLFLEIQKLKVELGLSNKVILSAGSQQCSAGIAAMKPGEPGQGKHPGTSRCWAPTMRQGSGCATLLLALLGLLGTPAAHGDCGPPPRMAHSKPSVAEQPSSFPVGSRVTYTCLEGAIKIPGRADMVQCLPGSRWSQLPEPCGLSCSTPTRLHFAALSEVDERINFFPIGFTVSYVCHPGYENISESSPTSTCLENLTWSEVAELCRRKSCGQPPALPGGRTLALTDFLFGARASVVCDEGYKLNGRNLIQCWLKGDDVEWSKLPTCELITCSSPPPISNGKHDGEGVEKFAYNSTVTYGCDSGFQLIGKASIQCTSTDKTNGVWSGAAPKCKEKSTFVKLGAKEVEKSTPPQNFQGNGIQTDKKDFTKEMKISLYKELLQSSNSFSHSASFSRPRGNCGPLPQLPGAEPPEDFKDQQSFSIGSKVTYRCVQGFAKLPSKSDTTQCLENARWSVLPEFCDRSCFSPPRVSFAKVSAEDEIKNFYAVNVTVSYVCNPGYTNSTDELPTSTCREDLTWSEVPELCERESCGPPKNPEHGTVVTTDYLFGSKADVICDDGYVLTLGLPFIRCLLHDDGVAWTPLPTCQRMQDVSPLPSTSTAGATAVTDAPKPLEEKTSEYRYILPLIIIPCIIGIVVIVIWTIKKCGVRQKGTYKPNPTNAGDEEQGPSCQERKTGPGGDTFTGGTAGGAPRPGGAARGRRARGGGSRSRSRTPHSCSSTEGGREASQVTGLGSAEPLIFLRSRKIPPRPARCPPTPERAVPAGCAAHRSDGTGTGTGTGTRRGTGTGMGAGTGTGIGLLGLCAVLLALPGAWGDCEAVPRFSFAEPRNPITNASYPVGSQVPYRCRPGYVGVSDKSFLVTCLPNNTWAWDPDFCIGKSCPEPDIENGKFHYSTDLRFGATINFTCNYGYRLVGRPSAQCVLVNNDVAWDKIPFCEIIPCEPPPVIVNGQFGGAQTEYVFGLAVTYTCNEGFSLIGSSTIYCTADAESNGIWSGPAPECKVVRCENPVVENGKKLTGFVEQYTYGDTVAFECLPGYFMNGSHTAKCDADNNWNPPLPKCERRYCGRPPSIPFAELVGTVSSSSPAGTTLEYRCNPGYATGDGKSLEVTCLGNTSWSVSSKSCTRQQCTPPLIENGFVKAEDFLFGATVEFSCREGYKLQGSSSAQCVASENGVRWDVSLPTCKAAGQLTVLCGEPPAVANGRHNGTKGEFAQGSIVVYKCNRGFVLDGVSSIRCTARDEYHGVWSTPTPECRGGATTIIVGSESILSYAGPGPMCGRRGKCPLCPSLPWVPGGHPPLHGGGGGGGSENSSSRSSWGPAPPWGWCLRPCCVGSPRVPVPWPREAPQLRLLPQAWGNWGAHISPWAPRSCSRDRSMVLAFALHLLGSSALLLAATAGAQVIRCPPPYIKNGKSKSAARYIYRAGASVSFTCNPGYTLQGSPTSTCQADSRWSPPLPECKKEVTCPQPPNIANGLHSGQSMDRFTQGAIVYYGCKDGFALVGNISINCSEAGQWSRPLPLCKAIGCERPEVRNGKVHKHPSTYEAGEILRFDCDAGHATDGAQEARCQPGGTWDPPVLACERVRPCPTPPKISNGDHDGHGKAEFTMGMFVTYSCDPGYYLTEDVSHVFCKASGNWSQPSPHCEEVTCPRPPNIANGLHSGQSMDRFPQGTTVYYGCKDGFALVGNISINCSEAGQWSRPLPRCQAIGCERPEVRNGKVHGYESTYEAGEILRFDCDAGHATEGPQRAQCQPGGSWDPPVLACERVRPCPMPPKIRNGQHDGHGKTFFTTGMSVMYSCDPGYYLVGNAQVVCKTLGNWSQPMPRCEATICIKPDVLNGQVVDGEGLIYGPGQTVTIRCQDGYSLQGTATILCQEDGSWEPPAPLCDLLHHQMLPIRPERSGGCGAPTRLPFAELKEEHRNEIDFSVGKTVKYTCRPGFAKHPGLSPTITCLESGVWSEALEFCKRKQCNHPGEPENGRITFLADLFFGSTVVYSCEEGHRLIGRSSRRCEISGGRVAWSGEIPTCQRIPCAPPPNIPHGKHTGRLLDEFHYGTSVTYSCEPGYPLQGEASIFCTTRDGMNGEWSGPPPLCGEARCPVPQIQNGRVVSAPSVTYTYKDTVTFECEPGYTMRGHSVVQCQLNSTWEPPVPACERAGCSAPPRLVFAELKEAFRNQSIFPVGRAVEYVCRPGYSAHPGMSATIVCLENQTWSAALEFCKGMQCENPEDPENGRAVVLTDLLLGSKVNYTCEKGYTLLGHSQRTCEISGTRVSWSGAAPVCQQVRCPSPPGIANGQHSGQPSDTFLVGSVVQYRCKDGYSLVENASLSCTAEGTWSRPLPRCEAIGCKRPEIEHGRTTGLEAVYKLEAIAVFECDFGYALKGSQESRCQFGGTWQPPVPTCEKMLQCPSPPTIKNGQHSSKDVTVFIPGTSVKYECDPGYVLTGKTTVSCLPSGTWSIPYPRCEVVTCMSPSIQDGEVAEGQQAKYLPGATVTFRCHPGYTMQGSQEAKCHPDGRWVPAVPSCEPALPCPPPPVIAHATHSAELGANFSSGMAVNYSCQPGFSLLGASSIWCTATGNWSRPYPRCAAGCGTPPPLLFAELNKEYKNWTEFPVGSTVKYSCRPGYAKHPQITPAVTCLENQTWSEVKKFCKRRRCSHPGEPENGRVIVTTDLFFGSTVNYTCDKGHRLVGASQRHCVILDSGTRVGWTGDVPVCQSILCEPPPDIPRGTHSGHSLDAFPYAAVVTYTCEPGHALAGAASIFCTTVDGEHGEWSGPPPRCGESQCLPPPDIANGRHSGQGLAVFTSDMSVSYSCDPGFVLVGEAHLNCTSAGAWSAPAPRCQAGHLCPPPPVIDHGQHDGKAMDVFSPGKSVNYSCDPGYSLVGKSSLHCTDNASWSTPHPRCEVSSVLQCPSPPSIEGGSHNSQEVEAFIPGMVVNYSCDPGFSLLGEASIYCTESGNWSLPPPQCAGGCGAPPRLSFAELTEEHRNQTAFPVGKTVRYACRPGYSRHPTVPPALTCLSNHTWSEARAFCKRKQCRYPEAPKNGRVVVLTDLLFGSIVNYTCEEGHRLVGPPLRRCELFGADVAWSGDLPICQKVVCPAPQIQNGKISVIKHRYRYKDTVNFTCHEGFTLRGHSMAQCSANRRWHPPVPVCEQDGVAERYHHPDTTVRPAVMCLPPPGIANGEHSSPSSDMFGVGALVHYRCKPGFVLIGNESVRCMPDRAWSRPLPHCEAGCVRPGVGNGEAIGLESLYRPGDIITIECNAVNVPRGPHKSQCQPGGTWDPPLPACSRVKRCSKPPAIPHGWHSGLAKAVFAPGTSVSYSCEPGFALTGMASIHCTESGAWSHPPPVCQAVKCPLPPNITNGKLESNISDTFPYRASVSYSCNAGYSLAGNAFINCTALGTWSQPPPRCEEIRCVFPEVQGVKKATSGNTYRFGTNITLECDDGYMLEGISQIQCQEDFSWDPPVPACKLTSRKSGSVGLGVAAAAVLLLLGAGIIWKIISKQKQGFYHTYENYNYKTALDQITEKKCSCLA
ncbi:complement receptor type 1 [Anas platyrhynchos]